MIRAARAAIAEKARIDQRLVIRVKRAAEAAARLRSGSRGHAEVEAKRREAEAKKAEAEAARKAAEAARQAREEKAREEKARIAVARPVEKPKAAEPRIAAEKPKPVERKAVLPAVQGISQIATLRPAPQPAPRSTPKIVVTEAPAAARPVEPEFASGQTSGRGGWKSVRRDPARILAQAKAKAKPANRADAIDLAQAAQSAIERFIAERGVTRTRRRHPGGDLPPSGARLHRRAATRRAGPSTSAIASTANPNCSPSRRPAASP